MVAKWLWGSVFKLFAHPSLLPIAIATFVSVAGPGGFAEFGHEMTAPTIAAIPQTPRVANEVPPALLVRVVAEETPVVAAPAVDPDAPPGTVLAEELLVVSTQAEGIADGVVVVEVAAPQEPEEPPAAPGPDHDPTIAPTTPEEPVDNPVEDGQDGDTGDDGDPPADDDPGSGNPPDADGVGEGDSPGDGGVGDGGTSDGSGSDDEADCDPPGNGPDPHDGVPPGHDQNGDGIDDRCQQNEPVDEDAGGVGTDTGTGDDAASNDGPIDDGGSDNGASDGDTQEGEGESDGAGSSSGSSNNDAGDDGGGDGGANSDAGKAQCDPPGSGHENHGTPPPGHDKNEDGVDDRCEDTGDAFGTSGSHARKNKDDG